MNRFYQPETYQELRRKYENAVANLEHFNDKLSTCAIKDANHYRIQTEKAGRNVLEWEAKLNAVETKPKAKVLRMEDYRYPKYFVVYFKGKFEDDPDGAA